MSFAPFLLEKKPPWKDFQKSPHEYLHVYLCGCLCVQRCIHLPDWFLLPPFLVGRLWRLRLFIKFISKSFGKTLPQPAVDLFEIRRVRPEQAHETDFRKFPLGTGEGWRNQWNACTCTQSCRRLLIAGRFCSVLPLLCSSAFTWTCRDAGTPIHVQWGASGCCVGHAPISRDEPGVLLGVCGRLC